MNNKLGKKQLCVSVVSLIAMAVLLAGAVTGLLAHFQKPGLHNSSGLIQEENIIKRAVQKLEAQKLVDKTLQAELESGSYTFESPLTVLDPYGESPLTALVLFETAEPSQIEITIPGEDEDTGAVYTFGELSTRHTIPVYGLYPDTVNEVTLRQLSENGDLIAENVVEIRTEPLPEWLDEYIILTAFYGGDYENGLNYVYDPFLFAFDKEGTPRWFLSEVNSQVSPKSYVDGYWLVPYGNYYEGDTLIFEVDLLGKISRIFFTPYGAHHDMVFMSNGNLLITGSHGSTTMDLIIELDAESGEIVNTLDLKTVLQRARFGSTQDWCHNNSIVWDESDGMIRILHTALRNLLSGT